MTGFYRRSALYSAFFEPSQEIRDSIDRLARRHLRRDPRRVLDPACGPGLWLAHFLAKGAEVAGSDLEEAAIALAAERLPARGARVLVGDMRRPPDELGAGFDCIVNLDNSIGHLPDYMDVVEHLASMRTRLARGGVYIVGLAIREQDEEIPAGVVYERGPVDIAGGGFAALRTESLGLQPVTRCERIRQIAITANVPDTPAVIAEQYDLLTFTFAMLRDILAASGGFEVLDCRDATDESLPAKPFRRGAGDVVLVLRASAEGVARGSAGKSGAGGKAAGKRRPEARPASNSRANPGKSARARGGADVGKRVGKDKSANAGKGTGAGEGASKGASKGAGQRTGPSSSDRSSDGSREGRRAANATVRGPGRKSRGETPKAAHAQQTMHAQQTTRARQTTYAQQTTRASKSATGGGSRDSTRGSRDSKRGSRGPKRRSARAVSRRSGR